MLYKNHQTKLRFVYFKSKHNRKKTKTIGYPNKRRRLVGSSYRERRDANPSCGKGGTGFNVFAHLRHICSVNTHHRFAHTNILSHTLTLHLHQSAPATRFFVQAPKCWGVAALSAAGGWLASRCGIGATG